MSLSPLAPLRRLAYAGRTVQLTEAPDLFALLQKSLQERPGDTWSCLLESGAGPNEISRYGFLCLEPQWVLTAKRRQLELGPPGALSAVEGDFFELLGDVLAWQHALEVSRPPEGPPFVGGLVGALGYELLHALEEVPDLGEDALALPDATMFFPGAIVAIDQATGAAWLFIHALGESAAEAEVRAGAILSRMQARLADVPRWSPLPLSPRPTRRLEEADLLTGGFLPMLPRGRYLEVVQRAKEEIFAGNAFEICTTTRYDTLSRVDPVALYGALRRRQPAPFAGLLRFDVGGAPAALICGSPERFMKLDRQGWAETRPIKGTRPRGRTPEEDEAQRHDLSTSEKDRAENVMIVDLARNDLGRVCELGSVTVPRLFEVEAHPFTHQLVSTIRGRLKPGMGAVDLLRAAFPGGSMTGAPKIEAMRIIERLEPVDRGLYAGSLGYFDVGGGLDLNIVIRSFVKRGERLSFHVGGAVVADSEPEAEFQELLDKAQGLLDAFLSVKDREGRP